MAKAFSLDSIKAPIDKRTVGFGFDENGDITHLAEGLPSLFTLDLKYCSPRQLKQLTADSTTRQVMNAKTTAKKHTTSVDKLSQTIINDFVLGGDVPMTYEVLSALATEIDYSKLPKDPAARITWDPTSRAFLAAHSDLVDVVYSCLRDFDFWHPQEKEQLGNSSSGPAGSTGAQAAGIA